MSLFVVNGFLLDDPGPNTTISLAFSEQHLNETGTLIYNSTDPFDNSTLVGGFHFPENSTGDNNPFDPFDDQDAISIIVEGLQNFTKLFTGGFIFDVLDAFTESIGIDFPEEFIIAMNVIFGFVTALFLVFVFFGRAFTAFT